MAPSRAQCRCGLCKKAPAGYKLLHPAVRKRHLAAEIDNLPFPLTSTPASLPSTPSSPLSSPSPQPSSPETPSRTESRRSARSTGQREATKSHCSEGVNDAQVDDGIDEGVRRRTIKVLAEQRRKSVIGVSPAEGELRKNANRIQKNSVAVSTVLWVVITVITFLYCDSRLSREKTNLLLAIASVAASLFAPVGLPSLLPQLLSRSTPSLYPSSFPTDVRTALKHLRAEPELDREMCCPKCFALYPLSSTSSTCSKRSAPRSPRCGASLRHPTGRPLRLFSIQRLEIWLADRLRNPAFEGALRPRQPEVPFRVTDIQGSRLWKAFRDENQKLFFVGDGRLGFSLYIDWFNPRGNKVSGKMISFGTIALFCLNLPPDLRLKPENIFLYSIIPGPREPSTIELNYLLRPLVDNLLKFWTPGVTVPTASTTEGRLFRAALVALISDLPAARKAAGFASHSAIFFCSRCLLKKADINLLEPKKWQRRHLQQHLECERAWLAAETEKARGNLLRQNGVRWSVLNELPYWNAPRMVILDIMHNLSGIMQFHALNVMGIGIEAKGKRRKVTTAENEDSEGTESSEVDSEEEMELQEDWNPDELRRELLEEVAALEEEARSVNSKGISLKLGKQSQITTNTQDSSYLAKVIGSEDEVNDDTFRPPRSFLSSFSLPTLRSTIANTSIPSWIDRPPINLGEPSHGKLKSDTWFKLFTIFLPLAACQFWTPRSDGQLENLFSLVSAINLASSHTVTPTHAPTLSNYLRSYLSTLRELFPHLALRPNHHLSLHIPGMMEDVGSLASLASWAGERFNHELSRAATNGKTYEMSETMMKRYLRITRLRETIRYNLEKFPSTFESLRSLLCRLFGVTFLTVVDEHLPRATEGGTQPESKLDKPLEKRIYNLLFSYLQLVHPLQVYSSALAYANSPTYVSPQAKVLSRRGIFLRSLEKDGRSFTTRQYNVGNSHVLLRHARTNAYFVGSITSIFKHKRTTCGEEIEETFVTIRRFGKLSEHLTSPFDRYQYLQALICGPLEEDSTALFSAVDIVCHLAVLPLKAGSVPNVEVDITACIMLKDVHL